MQNLVCRRLKKFDIFVLSKKRDMKKTALIIASGILFAMASCATHKTCPTYMKNNVEMEGVSASAQVK